MLRTVLVSLSVLLLASTYCLPQQSTGTIFGRVVDPSGLAISAATVTLSSDRTAARRETPTNESGMFTFLAVEPDIYSIRLAMKGFRSLQRTGMVLSPNERLSVGDIQLTLGDLAQQVTVTAEGAQVQTGSSENSGLLTAKQLEMILIRGRDPISLLRVLPGVSQTNDSTAVGGTWGSAIPNIQGARTRTNAASVDGILGSDFGDGGNFSATINMDAIAEVQVLLTNYAAEYGRNGGAQINIVTKSGGQAFHGTGYGYKRHEMFNANDFFNNRNNVAKPRYRYSTVGFNFGGPLYIPGKFNRDKSKLFFFYSFENWGTMDPQAAQRVTVPTTLERTGDFSQSVDLNGKLIPVIDPLSGSPFAGNIVPPSRVNGNGQALLKVFPLPNALDRTITGGNYNYIMQESVEAPKRSHAFAVDYRPSSKDTISMRGRIWWADTRGYNVTLGGSAWGLVPAFYAFTDNQASLYHSHIFSPTIVNEFNGAVRHSVEKASWQSDSDLKRIQRSQTGMTIGQLYPQHNSAGLIPQATFGGVTGAASITMSTRFNSRGADAIFPFSDNLSVIRNKHSLKFGIYVSRDRNTEGQYGINNGLFDFRQDVNNPLDSNYAYANALLGNFTSYTESSSMPNNEYRGTSLDWFAQDNWRVTPKLTLEYGMRFSYFTQWQQSTGKAASFALERYNPAKAPAYYRPARGPNNQRVGVNPLTGQFVPAVQIGAFVPNSGDVANGAVVATDTTYPAGFRDQQPVLFGPRFGFAYDPTGRGKTAIRGGFGIFYQTRVGSNTMMNFSSNPPIQSNPVIYYGNMNTFLSSAGVLFPSSIYGFEKRAPVTSIYNANFGIQRDVGFGTVVSASYVGSFGRHLLENKNLNQIPFGARFLAANADPTNPQTPLPDRFFRPYMGYENINYIQSAGTSNYHALQITANRRYAHGLLLGIAYTWSKTMDFVDSDTSTVATYLSPRVWNYGKAGFDQTHIFIFNYTWDVPKASRLWDHVLVRHAFDNWQVSGITSVVSGMPSGITFTTTDSADITGGGDGSRVLVTGKAQLPNGDRTFNAWFVPTVFARPAKGDHGNAPKDVFRLPGTNNWDISIFKNFPIRREGRFLQLRWEMYNAFNHTQFSGVDATARFDTAGKQVNTRFAQVIATRSPRVGQISLRFTF